MIYINKEYSAKIYKILAENIGCWGELEDFVLHVNGDDLTCGRPTNEYRIQGNLGFGGKFWNSNNKWYVNCYPEDKTKERLEIIAQTNQQLSQLRTLYLFGQDNLILKETNEN